MEVLTIKNIAFQIDDDMHTKIKIKATTEGKTIKDYILGLVKTDLEKKEK